jgi:Fe2+ transport system protein FeoA
MGLLPGTEITIVSNNISGPMTIAVKETRLVLGRGMVHRVMVA